MRGFPPLNPLLRTFSSRDNGIVGETPGTNSGPTVVTVTRQHFYLHSQLVLTRARSAACAGSSEFERRAVTKVN